MSLNAGLSTFAFGEAVFGEAVELSDSVPTPAPSPGRMRSQYGFNYSNRTWTRAYLYTLPRRRVSSGTVAGITISSVSGALIGKIRTDNLRAIVKSIDFTLDKNGCADFTLRLNRLPEFEILPFSILSINIGDSDFDWYQGQLTYPDLQGTQRDGYEFKGFGLRRYLETLQANTTFATGTDITTIIEDLVVNWIAPFCPIKYDAAKIDPLFGTILANDIQIGKFTIRKVLETLADMAQTPEYYYLWGVDGDGAFYWKKIMRDEPVRSMFVGYHIQSFAPKLNFEQIKNVVNVHRQPQIGSGDSGYGVVGLFNDVSSVRKYGRNELTVKLPGYFGDDDGERLGEAVLADLKDPKESAKTENYQATTEDDYLENGVYRIVMPLGIYRSTVQDVDDASEWTITGTGDLAKAKDSDIFLFADGCVRFDMTEALNQVATVPVDAQGIIRKVFFYVRSNRVGSFITVGVGSTTWNQYTTKIDIPIANTFLPIEWDITSLDVRKIGVFGFRVDEDFTSEVKVWIDKIDVQYSGHKPYKLQLTRSVYSYTPDGVNVKSEFGVLPASLVQYAAGLQAAASDLNASGELR